MTPAPSRLLRKPSALAALRMGLPPLEAVSVVGFRREGLSAGGFARVGLVVMTGTAETGRLG